jgi:prepilin signal peptidase PulO-like enzyme (type II secretory pathway)
MIELLSRPARLHDPRRPARPLRRQLPQRRDPSPAEDDGARLARPGGRTAWRGAARRRTLQPRHAALALPALRPPDHDAREHPDRQLPGAARALRHCGAGISKRYPIVEALTALLSAYAAWHFGFGASALGALLFVWAMVALTFIDLDTQLLPDDITLPLLWLGLAFNLGGTFAELPDAVIGAMAGYLALWSVFWLFKLATGKEGMGYGDFKLLAAIGAWLGWQMLPLTILLSSLVGAVVGIALIVFARHGRNVPIPFGPYLAAAGLIALFWGERITERYLGLL